MKFTYRTVTIFTLPNGVEAEVPIDMSRSLRGELVCIDADCKFIVGAVLSVDESAHNDLMAVVLTFDREGLLHSEKSLTLENEISAQRAMVSIILNAMEPDVSAYYGTIRCKDNTGTFLDSCGVRVAGVNTEDGSLVVEMDEVAKKYVEQFPDAFDVHLLKYPGDRAMTSSEVIDARQAYCEFNIVRLQADASCDTTSIQYWQRAKDVAFAKQLIEAQRNKMRTNQNAELCAIDS